MRPVPQATHQIYFHLVALKRHGLILSVSKQFASQIECDRNLAFGDAAKLKLEASAHVFYHS